VSPLNITSLLYGDVTFTYSMGRVIRDYLEEDAAL
jgi:acetoacetate decarboxylase